MVGLVVVSHSEALAEGVVALAREMGGEELALEAAGGTDEPGALGTDAERVRAAIERAMSDDGVLVLMDLGSALMSTEFAIEMLDGGGRVLMSEAPLVEGTVAAAVAARGGASLEEVAAEARGALAMKASQLGVADAAAAPDAGAAPEDAATPPDAEARLEVRNAIGLHARPAARFVEVARGHDAEVRVGKEGGGPPVRATSLTNVVALGARFGDTLVVSASGPQASEALEALLEPAHEAIAGGAAAERAWHDAAEQVAALYRGLDAPLLRERAADVLDVGRRVVAAVTGEEAAGPTEPGIVLAGELTPAQAAHLDPELVRGIATAHGSATAHAAILARALGLPAAVGLGDALLAIDEGTALLLDGEAGTLQVDPGEDVLREAEQRRERLAARRAAARERAREPGATRDGTRVEVFANLGSAAEAATAVELGAEGVGLLRTEFLFLDRPELPDEDEQVETLRQIAVALDGRPLVVRTLDAGADKPLPALPMPAEANPFLGVRGVRLTLERPEILATQLRAILRVAVEHPVKAMLPMVATLGEVRAVRALLDEARTATGIDAPLELGIMVEIPAAALTGAQLAEHVDFFSLGTNDLTQYTMAAERGDARLAGLLAGPQPAVLRLVKATVEAAAARGRWVGVCGELAGDPAAAVLLAGLGVTELSMAPALVAEVKAALRAVDIADARAAADAALDAEDADEARRLAAALL
jgi:phosphoenolpyruvate-protein phosphotransferase/dihydroxyacetone kinase phosphotransfer subunit